MTNEEVFELADKYGWVDDFNRWNFQGDVALLEFVDAVNMSQERVDETAKSEHEFECPRCGHCCQQREWVGLHEHELQVLEYNDSSGERLKLAKAVEAKLKEKNT
jgi:hypothetical protein